MSGWGRSGQLTRIGQKNGARTVRERMSVGHPWGTQKDVISPGFSGDRYNSISSGNQKCKL
jgi:hypothetical protein